MKKSFTLLLILVLAPVIAALYGILHDQLTYTISNEYYTRFKFLQFGLVEEGYAVPNPRVYVIIVGIMATWWMGIPIGLILGLTGLIHSGWQAMLKITLKAFMVTIAVTLLTGLTGLAYGYYQANNNVKAFTAYWYLPDNLHHVNDFAAVGSMHNFSYTGGVLGLVCGVAYIIIKKKTLLSLSPGSSIA